VSVDDWVGFFVFQDSISSCISCAFVTFVFRSLSTSGCAMLNTSPAPGLSPGNLGLYTCKRIRYNIGARERNSATGRVIVRLRPNDPISPASLLEPLRLAAFLVSAGRCFPGLPIVLSSPISHITFLNTSPALPVNLCNAQQCKLASLVHDGLLFLPLQLPPGPRRGGSPPINWAACIPNEAI
jgi:hypothetical protein